MAERPLDVREVTGSNPVSSTMTTKIETFLQSFLKKDLTDLRPGDTVRVFQKVSAQPKTAGSSKGKAAGKKDEVRGKAKVFEGLVMARKHGQEMGATITVRKVISGVGVEMIFPLHSPTIEKIEVVKRGKARRAKLYYLRHVKGKKAKLKRKEMAAAVIREEVAGSSS
jgi:large subunit ribosomal protein L19